MFECVFECVFKCVFEDVFVYGYVYVCAHVAFVSSLTILTNSDKLFAYKFISLHTDNLLPFALTLPPFARCLT